MKYSLQVLALGNHVEVPLSSSEYASIPKARDVLNLFGRFTENYRVVLRGYEGVEDCLHEVALGDVLHGFGGYGHLLQQRISLNSALLGYFASARYFLDSTDRVLKDLLTECELSEFSALRSSIYDDHKEYKFIEALRNYVQHRELPIQEMNFRNYVEDAANIDTSDLVTAVTLYASKATLQGDPKFKKAALIDMPDKIDIIHCARFHMSGIWSLHDYVMRKHCAIASAARLIIQSQIDLFSSTVGGSTGALHAVEKTDDGFIINKVPLFLDLDDARIESLRRLGNLSRLHKLYVSGKIKKA